MKTHLDKRNTWENYLLLDLDEMKSLKTVSQ